ncbi:hypothetical protein [Collimonas humicola]|uniref:hypothetical protein n=1 Tax=Collimonas humicola TaxID=2825886 RepID=UPI001B8ABE3F|nr:hypothetical protein [Collimonas humicola]
MRSGIYGEENLVGAMPMASSQTRTGKTINRFALLYDCPQQIKPIGGFAKGNKKTQPFQGLR